MTQTIKTGTTCIGLIYKDGVLLAADKRVTAHKIESDTFTKVFEVSKSIVSTVAGAAAAAQMYIRVLKSEIKLFELSHERNVRVHEAAMILNSMQYSGVRQSGEIVACILGGYDEKKGFSLYDLSFDGTVVSHEGYVTTGSGSVYAKSILDSEHKSNMSEKDAVVLAEKAFKAAFKNDNASGGGFIVKLITKDKIVEIEKTLKAELIGEAK